MGGGREGGTWRGGQVRETLGTLIWGLAVQCLPLTMFLVSSVRLAHVTRSRVLSVEPQREAGDADRALLSLLPPPAHRPWHKGQRLGSRPLSRPLRGALGSGPHNQRRAV